MAYEGGRSMDVPKKNRPNSKAKIAARIAARKESGMSAQKFYVTTRLAEAAKSGKKLDRAALRKKFQSGDVARKGFAAPKKKMGGSGSSSTGSSSSSKSSSSNTPGMGGSRTLIAPVPGPKKFIGPKVSETTKPSAPPLYSKYGGSTKESKKADRAKKIADADAKYKSDQAKQKSDYDNRPDVKKYRAQQAKEKSDYYNSPQQKAYKSALAVADARRAKAMADNKAKQDAKKKKK